jgi:hypothetical protein
MSELVDYVEHAEPASLVGAIVDKVVRPDVIGTFRPLADARPVGEAKTAMCPPARGDCQSWAGSSG